MKKSQCKHEYVAPQVAFIDLDRGKAHLILTCDNCETQIIMSSALPGIEP